jgi:hypothetical protein
MEVMTSSNFDPNTGHPERSGARNGGPDADNLSHLPSDLLQGAVKQVKDAEADLNVEREEPIQQFREGRRQRRSQRARRN